MSWFWARFSLAWLHLFFPHAWPIQTTQQRERQRKAFLLALLLSIIFPILLPFIGQYLILGNEHIALLLLIADGISGISIWILRKQRFVLTVLVYLTTYSGVTVMGIAMIEPSVRLMLWIVFALQILLCGLFLPFWVCWLFGIGDIVLCTLLWFSPMKTTTWFPPEASGSLFSTLLFVLFFLACIGSLYAWSTERAIIQADRAEELAVMNQTLQELHADMEQKNGQLSEANIRLEALATTDVLTGMVNHRGTVAALDHEMERSLRYGHLFSLLFMDIDHFKALNDTFGHNGGDEVLRTCAKTIQTALRDVDIVGRWGGEEFLAILPKTNAEQAVIVAEKVRVAVSSLVFPIGAGIHITCSLGVACYQRDGTDRESLIASADQAMYAAKQLGRNQVRSANELAVKSLIPEAQSRNETEVGGVIDALTSLIQARDGYTGEHSASVGQLVLEVAVTLDYGKKAAQLLSFCGRLHDIGKVGIPDAILQKPGKLTSEEWKMMQTHPLVGSEIVSHIPSLKGFAPSIRSHHERWDGKGYPDGLAGEEIPIGARIIAIVDAYAALITDRPYQFARPALAALEELKACAGSQFDPLLVEIFIRLIESKQTRTITAKAA